MARRRKPSKPSEHLYELDGPARRDKVQKINAALSSDPVDIFSLRQYAISPGGLVNDSMREKAWPKLLAVNAYEPIEKPNSKALQSHRDYSQVVLDVRRSDRRFPPGTRASFRRFKQSQLTELIARVLHQSQSLFYYQGFHELCVPFLLICGPNTAVRLLNRLCSTHLQDFMGASIAQSDALLAFLYPIIAEHDKQLEAFLCRSEVGTVFCLSWILTWYSHVLSNWDAVGRLYDVFLASHPLMPVYLAAAIVLHMKDSVLSVCCELSAVHGALRWPAQLPVEYLVNQAQDSFMKYSPAWIGSRRSLRLEKSLGVQIYMKCLLPQLMHQRPDHVLSLLVSDGRAIDSSSNRDGNHLLKHFGVAVWAFSTVLGAAYLLYESSVT